MDPIYDNFEPILSNLRRKSNRTYSHFGPKIPNLEKKSDPVYYNFGKNNFGKNDFEFDIMSSISEIIILDHKLLCCFDKLPSVIS